MADEFDRVLRDGLAPAEREEDHLFVARVQAAISIEERLRLERRAVVRNLALQLLALAAVAAALLWIGRAPAVSTMMADSPWLAALVLIAGFGVLVALLTARGTGDPAGARYSRGLTS
jgi:cytochrome bd-type quinol oxidase subunit 2